MTGQPKGRSLPSATKLRRLCFYRHVSVHRGGVPDQVHPPGTRYTPRTRSTPGQVHPPTRCTLSRPGTPPRPGTSPWQVHPPDQVHPLDQVHPPDQVHIPRAGTHPPPRPGTHPPEIRPLLRTVRILLECILVTSNDFATAV